MKAYTAIYHIDRGTGRPPVKPGELFRFENEERDRLLENGAIREATADEIALAKGRSHSEPVDVSSAEDEITASNTLAEADRLAAEKIAEAERLAAEKIAEAERLAAEKIAEAERKAAEVGAASAAEPKAEEPAVQKKGKASKAKSDSDDSDLDV